MPNLVQEQIKPDQLLLTLCQDLVDFRHTELTDHHYFDKDVLLIDLKLKSSGPELSRGLSLPSWK
ncbi:MAG: hypothetical protein BWY29_00961 [Microgenomates group bacterium ADurb.Bin238]|nr:MAG: hypothetical protein BWY29_00961 [Microgenomates group bacterium ADurb.Bin238]